MMNLISFTQWTCSHLAWKGVVSPCLAILTMLVMGIASGNAAEQPIDPAQARFFETHVRPLLVEHCLKCHGETGFKGGLRVDSRGHLLLGGESGAAIIPGKPEESLLLEAVRYESFEMPPSKKLKDEDIAILEKWVAMGAPWPGDDGKVAIREKTELFSAADRSWWAIQPLKMPDLPKIENDRWARNEIDYFIAKSLSDQGLTPAPEANKGTLIRRLYFDLIGLPPSPEEVRAFLADDDEYAYERLVDQLLARPEYGERWARHWLDLVRYADSDGYRADSYRPLAWKYRDYVIQSLNEDKPYNRFVQEQIAGDQLFPGDPQTQVATGYMLHGIYEYNSRDAKGQWDLIMNELTDVTSDVFLGLGLQCARCHDHKFDPLLQKDYYRLRAFFEPIMPHLQDLNATPEQLAEFEAKQAIYDEQTRELQKELEQLEGPIRAQAEQSAVKRFPDDVQELIRKPKGERTPYEEQVVALAWRQALLEHGSVDRRLKGDDKEKVLELRRKLAAFSKIKPEPLSLCMCVRDVGPEAPETVIPKKQGAIEPGYPTIMDAGIAEIGAISDSESTGRRATLAKWMTDDSNPLTTRVIVNRVWQYHFGTGIAENSSDFGRLGAPPTHPELLDWLTLRFIRDGWHLKGLHKLIVNSSTYRQSATHPEFADYEVKDPSNTWYWRASTRRLDAEQIRDSILMVSGKLDSTRGGAGVLPDKPRRSIYTRIMRNSRDPLLDAFDLPQFFSSTSSRDTTTSPIQSLLLINSQTMLKHADDLFKQVLATSSGVNANNEERLHQLWWSTFGRAPEPEELKISLAFLEEQAGLIKASVNNEVVDKVVTGKMPYRDGQSILLLPDGKQDQLVIDENPKLDSEDFTVEIYFQLRSIYETGGVRTFASKKSNAASPGWAFGVTGKGSRRKPQTLVLQLYGRNASGGIQEAALFSDQHVEINKPYYAAATVKQKRDGQPGSVTFHLKDLSNDDEPLLSVTLPYDLNGNFNNEDPLVIGARAGQGGNFDGLIDDIRISKAALETQHLLYTSEGVSNQTLGYWQFDPSPGIFQDSSGNGLAILTDTQSARQREPYTAAFVDLCHILLNSNEFLYVD